MDDIPIPLPAQPVKFMDRFRFYIRSKHLAYRTEKTYCRWVADFICFCGMRRPEEVGGAEVEAYLSHLAVQRHVAVNTQKVALNSLVFLYRNFLNQPFKEIPFIKSGRQKRLPVVFSHAEASQVIAGGLFYGDRHLAA